MSRAGRVAGPNTYIEAMTAPLGDPLCWGHGWLTHAFVHEAGHCVAALDRGIPFERVFIHTRERWTRNNADERMLGGVVMHSDDPKTWVMPDPVSALEYVLAGSLSEDAVLGDFIKEGYYGDQRVWRIALGVADGVAIDRIDELAGGSLAAVVERMRSWTAANKERIANLAAALAAVTDVDEIIYLGSNAGPWSLEASQVAALVCA